MSSVNKKLVNNYLSNKGFTNIGKPVFIFGWAHIFGGFTVLANIDSEVYLISIISVLGIWKITSKECQTSINEDDLDLLREGQIPPVHLVE